MSIVVVLHEPQDLVNIAHVVRALKNFGFRDLRLVNPREYEAYRIEGIAHQTQDVLARVARFDRLERALADCVHVVGFTARERSAKRNPQRPRQAAAEIVAQAEAGLVALLFGREDKGLPNDALDLCHRVVTIPTNPAYASLQLGHAVVLMLYELALARGDDARPFKAPRREAPPAATEELERLFADVEAALRLPRVGRPGSRVRGLRHGAGRGGARVRPSGRESRGRAGDRGRRRGAAPSRARRRACRGAEPSHPMARARAVSQDRRGGGGRSRAAG